MLILTDHSLSSWKIHRFSQPKSVERIFCIERFLLYFTIFYSLELSRSYEEPTMLIVRSYPQNCSYWLESNLEPRPVSHDSLHWETVPCQLVDHKTFEKNDGRWRAYQKVGPRKMLVKGVMIDIANSVFILVVRQALRFFQPLKHAHKLLMLEGENTKLITILCRKFVNSRLGSWNKNTQNNTVSLKRA